MFKTLLDKLASLRNRTRRPTGTSATSSIISLPISPAEQSLLPENIKWRLRRHVSLRSALFSATLLHPVALNIVIMQLKRHKLAFDVQTSLLTRSSRRNWRSQSRSMGDFYFKGSRISMIRSIHNPESSLRGLYHAVRKTRLEWCAENCRNAIDLVL